MNQKINSTKFGLLVVRMTGSDVSAVTRDKYQDRENIAMLSVQFMFELAMNAVVHSCAGTQADYQT